MTYSLWETDSANIIGTFAAKADALALVRDFAGSMGPAYIESFSLTSTADDGTVEGTASGTDLMTLAGQCEPADAPPAPGAAGLAPH